MLALYLKEIRSFLASLSGYVVIAVFLIFLGLFLWVFEGNFNILNTGFATLTPFFNIAPWIFCFLIPAITMRSFSEEKRLGTLELLLTKPLTPFQIIFPKYLAGLSLVTIAIVPTLCYYFTMYYLGRPMGNIDSGAVWGSYIGLIFLSSGFVAIGLFASALTDNQIVAFLLSVLLSFFFYVGFEAIGSVVQWGKLGYFLNKMGINEHYLSLSKGVIDSRDILYFLSLSFVFMVFTKMILEKRK
ncbi:MAG: ABC-2 type transport system permease protein [Luteibaculaceae bacterium]|jgi:ABC-2 type transport system permease protein